MYSQRIIRERLAATEATLGFRPERHSIAEVIEANRNLEEIWDADNSRWRRDLKVEEQRWVRNEITVCQQDFRYWLTRYAHIRTSDERVIRCVPNVAQNMVIDVWADMQERQHAICLQELKARQLGISTIVEMAVAHRAQFHPNVNAVVGSSDPDKSAKMAGMMELAWRNQPRWLLPNITKYKGGELIEFGGLNSGVSIQHGAQMTGIARGTTPSVVHLSELSDYKNPAQLVDASLVRAMHPFPNMLFILESTANGEGNWWHKTWKSSKSGWAAGRSFFRPMFLPWFVGTDFYPTETWMRMHPIPKAWEPSEITRKHAEKAARYVASEPLLRKYLGDGWTMPQRQQWYYEVDREEHREKRELSLFLSEMPGDDVEAFQSRHRSIFDVELTNQYEQSVREPIAVYSVQGYGIPERLHPLDRAIDRSRPAIRVTANWLPTHQPLRFRLVPIKREWWDDDDGLDKLYLWEWPKDDEEYTIGGDMSEGIGLDRAVLEVLRKGTFTRNDEQVAEFASSRINALDMWPICMAVGTLYSVKFRGALRQPKAVIEVQAAGDNCQHELRKHGWRHFHQWVRLDNKRINVDQANKLGWVTNAWSRPLLVEHMVKYIRDGAIDINSKYLIGEMKTLVMNDTVQRMKIQASDASFDDRFMATGLALTSSHIMEVNGNRQELAYARIESRRTDIVSSEDYVPDYVRGTVMQE